MAEVDEDGLLTVGWISRAHGLRGEVILRLTSNRPERVEVGAVLQSGRGPLTVLRSAKAGDGWRVGFEGIVDRTAAESLRGLELRAAPIEIEGVVWVHELLGAMVVLQDGSQVGPVIGVEENPAHDLLVVAGERSGKPHEHLIPMVFVSAIEDRVITIDPPEGLLDL